MKKLDKMTVKERKEVLAKVVKEIQKIDDFEPPFESTGKSETQLKAWLKEVYEVLDEEDKVSKKAQSVFEQLGFVEEEEAAEEETEETIQDTKVDKKDTSKKASSKKTQTKEKGSTVKVETEKSKNKINRQSAVLETINQKCKKPLTMNQIAEFSNELYIKKNKDIKGISKIQNMMNVVRHSVIALEEFGILKCEDSKYLLS